MNKAIFIIGVSGSGKSTIGALLAKELGIPCIDGDDYHPQENIDKMSQGIPLNDVDRYDWLIRMNTATKIQLESNNCVIVCSALKQRYRDLLSKGIENQTKWVHLSGTFETIQNRMKARKDHFMPSKLLKSQFDALEIPKTAITLNIMLSPKEIVENIKHELIEKSEFGLIGLGVMGKSLCRNLSNKGFNISMFNRHVEGIEEHIAVKFKTEYKELSSALAFDNMKAFVESLQTPRKIMLMVNAGNTVDFVIEDLLPLLSAEDIIIDGGNSNYINTNERYKYLKSKNINFIGMGVSGGEAGALNGPSLMPGGNKEIYNLVQPYLESIAAKDANDLPCCTYIGEEGSGHFVKMVHNGIEYVEMQLLAEVYSILTRLGHDPDSIANILDSWSSEIDNYLLEITIDILRKKEDNDWLINKIVDKAGNKGTGNWATITTAELGVPSTMIASSLFTRYLSFFKEDREKAQLNYGTYDNTDFNIDLEDLFNAYQFARIINHHQGFSLLNQASITYRWDLDLSEIARIWTNGCIIRSDLMKQCVEQLKISTTILNNKFWIKRIRKKYSSSKKVVTQCILNEISVSCLSDSVNFFNAFKTGRSSANIIQAQRDYFGAHTYQRIDDISGRSYHSNWKE